MVSICRIGDSELAYDDWGEGRPIVLIHAACADRRMWDRQVAVLRDSHRVIRYDWRGYGDSSDARGDFAHHEDLLALLDALGAGPAVLIGASDGGRIALDATLVRPERVTALMLIGSGLSGHVWPASMLALYRERVHEVIGTERLRAYRTGLVGPVDPDDLRRYAEAETEFLVAGPARKRTALGPDVWDLALDMDKRLNFRRWSAPQSPGRVLSPPAVGRLGDIRAPVMVVTGDQDLPEIRALADTLGTAIPGAVRRESPEVAHLFPLERPDLFNATLLQFLQTVASPMP